MYPRPVAVTTDFEVSLDHLLLVVEIVVIRLSVTLIWPLVGYIW